MEVSQAKNANMCRGCMATTSKLVNASPFGAVFKDLTGIVISPSDGLPQGMCTQCSTMLAKIDYFRQKAIRSHYMLSRYIQSNVPSEVPIMPAAVCPETPIIVKTETLKTISIKQEKLGIEYKAEGKRGGESGKTDGGKLQQILTEPSTQDTHNTYEVPVQTDTTAPCDTPVIVKTESVRVKVERDSQDAWGNDHNYTNNTSASTSNTEEQTSQPETQLTEVPAGSLVPVKPVMLSKDIYILMPRPALTPYYNAVATTSAITPTPSNEPKNPNRTSRKGRYKCDHCNRSFNDKTHLIAHVGEHAVGPYKCDACNVSYVDKKYLIKHQLRAHINNNLKCETCNTFFKHKRSLKKHMSLHTGEKTHECNVCKKVFSDKSNLKIHYRIHTGDKPFKCDVCDKSFTHQSTFSVHKRLHTGVKPFKCEVCMKCFVNNHVLKEHMRIHTGVRPYKCDVCGQLCSSKSHLTIHMRKHTGDKPYKCEVCSKAFARKHTLTVHSRVHTGDKPYKCDICNVDFRDWKALDRHSVKHIGERRATNIVIV